MCCMTKIILKRKNIGQSLLKKHSKIRNFDEIFYCGLTRLKNTNLDDFIQCQYTRAILRKKDMGQSLFNPTQDGLFRGCSRMGGGAKRPPSLKSVTHILQWWNLAQLYLTQRRSKKYMNHVTHPLSSADISIFSPEISKFCYIKKYRCRLYFHT